MSFDAPPTQAEIADALALQSSSRQAQPQSREEGAAVAERIYADWRAAHEQGRQVPDLASFVRDVAQNESVTHEGRGAVRAFWSFMSQPEGAPEPVGHRFLAQACGKSRDLQVLEDSPAGSRLDSYQLWNKHVQSALVRDYELDSAEVADLAPEVWSTVSQRYAEAAQGPVVAFATDIVRSSVLGKDELPRLLAHDNVGKDNIKFPLPAPRHGHLPPEIDELITNDAMRAQVCMDDFDPAKSPKEFARKLGGVDVPEKLRDGHEAALWRLQLADSYEELNARAKPVQRAAGNEFLPGVDVRPVARPAAPRGPTAGHGVLNPAVALTLPPPVPQQQPAGVER
ncbi:hypothetical protein ACWD4O_26605 [Streptomyces sp. NPDC002623]